MKEIKYYVRGNIAFPNGVINRLIMLGGNAEHPFSEAELANPANLFYIDFYNDNLIRKVTIDSVTGEMILEFWTEIQPFTYIDEPESLPATWSEAIEKCIEAKNYANGLNTDLNIKLNKLGSILVLRDIYRQGWFQKGNDFCYYISNNLETNELEIQRGIVHNRIISFQDLNLCEMFFENFKNSLEEIKEFL